MRSSAQVGKVLDSCPPACRAMRLGDRIATRQPVFARVGVGPSPAVQEDMPGNRRKAVDVESGQRIEDTLVHADGARLAILGPGKEDLPPADIDMPPIQLQGLLRTATLKAECECDRLDVQRVGRHKALLLVDREKASSLVRILDG